VKNIKMVVRLLACLTYVVVLQGCALPAKQASPASDALTVGTVQREIKLGMSGADVIAALGSPNIVSTDSERREVWVYDKMSSSVVSSSQSGFVFLLVTGGESKNKSATRTQKTLTIIVKFNENGEVRDYKYHSSSF